MFCSQCGKKVKENMLFCPFCGSPIVIPEQDDEPVPAAPAAEEAVQRQSARPEKKPAQHPELTAEEAELAQESGGAAADESAEPADEEDFRMDFGWESRETCTDAPEPGEPFVPLDIDALMAPRTAEEEPEDEDEDEDDDEEQAELHVPRMDEPVKLQGRVPNLVGVQSPQTGGAQRRLGAGTSQLRDFDPDDMFLDGSDRYDEEEDEPDEYDEYDEPERGSFFVRHIRGIVAFSLFAVLVIIIAAWLFSGAGQAALAKANLAWNPVVYAELARDAYEENEYVVSGGYYERALERDPDNYDYAKSAGIAYYYAGDTKRALEMAKRAITLDPARYDCYQLLLYLYPDVNTRPWDVSTLLQQGYRLTGREELKPA